MNATNSPDPGGLDRARLTRRNFVVGSLTGGGALLLAACGSSGTRQSAASTSNAPSAPVQAASEPVATTAATSPPTNAAVVASADTTLLGDIQTDQMTLTVSGGYRNITTTSMPSQIDPDFRYPGTPSAQNLAFKVTTNPQIAANTTFVRTGQVLGVRLDGVVFDPKTAEFYNHERDSAWNYTPDALDIYGAHTRPTGFYHLHQITDQWVSDAGQHSTLTAWAADGFPVYLRYGYTDANDPASGVKNLTSSYRLKSGTRPSGSSDPGGTYDGTYVADYEYVEGLGDLDECSGRQCVTPEFPNGTYAYFLTDQWPYVPNNLRGTPDPTFAPGYGGGSA